MSNLEIILTVVLALVLSVVLIYYAVKVIKANYSAKVYETIVQAMKEAETKYTDGKEKKAYVLDKVKSLCKEVNIPYDFIAKLVSKIIENILKGYNSMTK